MNLCKFTHDLPSALEWWEAIRWVVFVFSLIVLLMMLGSFVPYENVVQNGHPWIPKFTCPGCIFCGMTRSFCAMSAGYWSEAFRWNRGGPVLYIIGWSWTIFFLVFSVRQLNNKFRTTIYIKQKNI
jgi:hypothetical protein